MTRLIFDPPSEPPDGDPVCRICDHVMEYNSFTREWECTHDHDALDEEQEKHPHAGCYTSSDCRSHSWADAQHKGEKDE